MRKRRVSENASRKTIMTRQRVRKHRIKQSLLKERQNFVRDRLQKNINFSSNEGMNTMNGKSSLESELREWSKTYNISAGAINSLLKILIVYGFTWLPSDYRSLLETPRNIEILKVANGKFWYNGLTKTIEHIFSNLTRDIVISLKFNVDGLPLFNSSKLQFWSILASIHGD